MSCWTGSEADGAPATVYRLNTFPLMHLGFFHLLCNVLALAPLLERFEAEFGTLITLSLFSGRERTCTSSGAQEWSNIQAQHSVSCREVYTSS